MMAERHVVAATPVYEGVMVNATVSLTYIIEQRGDSNE
jgi:hypothetical protein